MVFPHLFHHSLQQSISSVPGISRSKLRKDDVRLTHAHLLRTLAVNLPPNSLTEHAVSSASAYQLRRMQPRSAFTLIWHKWFSLQALREKLLEFVLETVKYIITTTDISPELQQLRYCVCVVSRQLATQLARSMPEIFDGTLRKSLFGTFSLYCEEGTGSGAFPGSCCCHTVWLDQYAFLTMIACECSLDLRRNLPDRPPAGHYCCKGQVEGPRRQSHLRERCHGRE
jgi:hypothetical protein